MVRSEMGYESDMDKTDFRTIVEERDTIGSQLRMLAESVAKYAASVSEETHGRLVDVSREDSPNVSEKPQDSEQWPRLFSDVRDSLRKIDACLTSIERSIRRVEV
jgi:hypothetical protein